MMLTMKNNRQGSILIHTLWILALLLLMSVSLSIRTSIHLNLAKNHRNQKCGYLLAQAGIHQTIYNLLQKNSLSEKNSTESSDIIENQKPFWVYDESKFQKIEFPSGYYSIFYKVQDPIHMKKITVFGIQDEERLLNINSLDEEFYKGHDYDSEIYSPILDWIDSDDQEKRDGAENNYYHHIEPPYNTKNSAIEFFEEMPLIYQMEDENIKKFKDSFTIYGSGKVNFNTATSTTFELLGFDESLTELILDFRKGNDQILFTEDDNWIESPEEIQNSLYDFESLNAHEVTQITNAISEGKLGTQSEFYRIESYGYPYSNPQSKKLICVVEIYNENQYRIHEWKQGS